MINNYKSIRNVRAEASNEILLGEPVSLYIAEDEVKVTGTNIIENGDFETGSVLPWVNGDMDTFEISTDHATGTYSLHLTVGDADDIAYVDFTTKVGSQYVLRFNRTIPNHDAGSSVKYHLGHSGDVDAYTVATASDNITTGRFREEIIFTATVTTSRLSVIETGTANDANVYIDDIQCYEISDHSYKLMAVNDTIPASGVNGDALGGDLITNGAFADDTGWSHDGTVWDISGGKMVYAGDSSGGSANQSVTITSGRTYEITYDCSSITSSGTDEWRITQSGGSTIFGSLPISSGANTVTKEASLDSSGTIRLRGYADSDAFSLDDLTIKEYFGFDYYNAPAYKFGIVSNIWDQDSGGLITTASAGDQVEVTVQGECNIIRSDSTNMNIQKDYLIGKILNDGEVLDYIKTNDGVLPNSVGTVVETNTSSTTAKVILWQGVEFSESFVHKNSLQVHAKCDEAITKFRPVSLFLDSAGDLLCRHDDIPETLPDSDTDHTGVDPGKWGIAELGGASGDLIPITVAGKVELEMFQSQYSVELQSEPSQTGNGPLR